MNDSFRLLPPSASALAGEIDLLFYSLTGLTGVAVLGVVAAMTYFSLKYRRGSKADRGRPRKKERRHVEFLWITLPLLLFLGMFYWGASLYAKLSSPPADALEIYVVAKQWMWKLQHQSGQREIDELHIPKGVPIKLIMTSEDVIHSFYVPAFRAKQDVVPGRYLTLWFTATEKGRYRFLCAEYCGTQHSHMRGIVTVMEPAEYEQWLRQQDAGRSLAAEGEAVFRQYGCSGCHDPDSSIHAPSLAGIYGKPVHLKDGGTVRVDDRYIHDSIVQPKKHVVAGYEAKMPSFEGQISEEEIFKLVAYIKSLSENQRSPP